MLIDHKQAGGGSDQSDSEQKPFDLRDMAEGINDRKKDSRHCENQPEIMYVWQAGKT